MVRILGDDGNELAIATLRQTEHELLSIERVVRGKGSLLHYYFGEGRRIVHVESGNFILTGTIRTQWTGGERLWYIKLAVPLAAPSQLVGGGG